MKKTITLSADQQHLHERNIKALLELIDGNPEREGLKETPKRYLKFLIEFCTPKEFEFKSFTKETDEMIIIEQIAFSSLCEHHLAPFSGHGAIAYIPGDKQVGLSKLPRTLQYYSAGLQNQERICKQVADRIQKELNPLGVAVILKASHTCMSIRGAKCHEANTITSEMRGKFRSDPACRAEFMSLIQKNL